jgi:rhodanese-related sulfurtransferase
LLVVREVDLRTFVAAHADGAMVVDVREPGEYLAGHVPGAKLLPLAGVSARVGELPTDRTVFVICATGNRSLAAAGWMRAAGVDAYSVAGGTSGWVRMGRPVVAGPHENAA